MKIGKKRRQLKWSMIVMLTGCWFLPLLMLALTMLLFVSDRMKGQLEDTIITSADRAMDICQMRINEAMAASKDASYLPAIKDSYISYQKNQDKKQLLHDANLFIQQQYRFNSDFNITVLYFIDDPEVFSFTYKTPEQTYAKIVEFKKTTMDKIQEVSGRLGTDIAFVNINGEIYMVRNIVDSRFRPFAVLVMELNMEHMFGGLESVWGYKEMEVYIDGESLFNHYPSDPGQDITGRRIMDMPYFSHGAEGSFVYKRMESGRHKMSYLVMLDSGAITGEMTIVRYLIILFVIFMIPLITVVFLFFHLRVNKPIGALRRACKEIAQEHYGYQIAAVKQDEEFHDLGETFNDMSIKLKYQFEKIYLEELALRDANIMALQSQINPHFLNNTLEIINWEARMMGNQKVSGMIEALSTMMEATMNRKNEQYIKLAEELSYVDAYLYIIAQRLGDGFECEKRIDESLLWVEVPRLIIQPIIENAVEHGMDVGKQGRIRLTIYRQGDKLCIEVLDNGRLSEKDRAKIDLLLNENNADESKSLSLGIRNVNKRLKIIYGAECGLSIKSNKDGHTVSTIIVKIDNLSEQ